MATNIISSEEFWSKPKEERDTFHGFYVHKVTIAYAQKIHDNYEELTMETADEGGGRFVIMSTEKFSFNPEELNDILKDFCNRAELKFTTKEEQNVYRNRNTIFNNEE